MNKKSTSKAKLDKSKPRPLSAGKKGISLIKQSKSQIEAVFKKLYPISLVLYKSSEQIVVNLSYKTKTLKIKLSAGIPTNNLPYFLHRQIYRQQCITHQDPQKALAQTAKIIGFYTQNGDILLDYRISQGIGTIDHLISLKCLKYKNNFTTTPLQKYNILKCLAIGGFSKVYLVRSLTNGKFYALKAISKDFIAENQKQSIITNQKDICKMLDHPFIVKMNHCFETNNFLCFVFDFCPGGQLFFHLKRIKRMTQEQAKFYFQEIMYGLQYLHQQGIIYRDLKPQNLLIGADGHIKIADFGLSKAGMDRQPTYSFCGSAQYMPPQMILRTGHSFGVDHYTLGALLYELVTGLPPFYSRDQQQIKRAILQQQLQFPPQIQLSTQIKTLLRGLLNKNPKQRLGCMKGIKQILFHPWLQRVKAQDILQKRLIPPFLPDINEFNFDSDQLGDDEQQFTTLLLQDRTTKMQRSPISGFQYEAGNNLSPQHLNLLKMNFVKNKKSSSSPMKLKPSPSLNCLKSNSVKSLLPSKQQFKKSASCKSIKTTNTNKLSKTMISSPYYSKQNKLKNSYSISNITNPLKNTKIKSTLMKKSIKGLSIKKLR